MDNLSDSRAIAVFGSARVAPDSTFYAEAHRVGDLLARAGFIVINGGYGGTMEASAKGAHEAGGRVIGVTSKLFTQNALNNFVHEEIETEHLHDRIRQLVIRSDGFVVLRGGIGTLAELQIVWNLATLDPTFHRPIILLGDFWRDVIETFERNLQVNQEHIRYLQFASTPAQCVELLAHAFATPRDGAGHPSPRAPSPP